MLDASDIVFLTVPDDAIGAVCASLRWRAGHAAVHCAGATELAALQSAADAGAAIGGFHPLVMFADPEIAARSIAGAAIGIEASEPLAGRLRRMVTALGARELVIPPGGMTSTHAPSAWAMRRSRPTIGSSPSMPIAAPAMLRAAICGSANITSG